MISFGWSEFISFLIIVTVVCNLLIFFMKFEKKEKIKIPQISSYEFKILSEYKLFADINSRVVYEIEYNNKYIFISLFQNMHGEFIKYYKNKLIPISISSNQTNEIIKFMYIDSSNLIYNLKTLIVYELNVLESILVISPYITSNGNKCQYNNGTILELLDE